MNTNKWAERARLRQAIIDTQEKFETLREQVKLLALKESVALTAEDYERLRAYAASFAKPTGKIRDLQAKGR